jgi:hypothetical protein
VFDRDRSVRAHRADPIVNMCKYRNPGGDEVVKMIGTAQKTRIRRDPVPRIAAGR